MRKKLIIILGITALSFLSVNNIMADNDMFTGSGQIGTTANGTLDVTCSPNVAIAYNTSADEWAIASENTAAADADTLQFGMASDHTGYFQQEAFGLAANDVGATNSSAFGTGWKDMSQ